MTQTPLDSTRVNEALKASLDINGKWTAINFSDGTTMNSLANLTTYKGVIDCSSNPNYPAANAGWLYVISVACKIGGASGVVVETGDIIICLTDGTVSGTHAVVGSNWNILQTNINGAVTGPTSSVDNNVAIFNSTSGKIIKDSGLTAIAQAVGFTIAGGTTNKTLTVPLDSSVSGTNTGDNATNCQYSELVSNATHTGDATGATALTVVAINGTTMSGLATGILKNTTTTGVPSIAIAADFPTLNQNTTGNAATVTTNANLTDVITSVGNATSIASQTGIGTTFVVNNSPTIEGTTIANITRLTPLQIQSVLEAADVADNDKFGAAVALNSTGSILAVGAYDWEGASGTNRGGGYIYDWNGSAWVQRGSVLEAADAADNDQFGISVALNSTGSILAVGAYAWEGASGTNRGGVYIYDWNGSAWVQRGSVLEAADAADSDNFGISVALNSTGSILAVGAYLWEGASGTDRGGGYIYDWNGSAWVQRGSVLEAADAADSDYFGYSVALNSTGSILAVGAYAWEGASGTNRGGVYSYLCQSDGMPQRDTFSIKSSFGTIGDSSASPGNATLNTVSGKSAISLASSSVVITNSFVSSTSMIFITPLSLDATATAWKYSVADGSFTITTNAATTADWLFSWIVFN